MCQDLRLRGTSSDSGAKACPNKHALYASDLIAIRRRIHTRGYTQGSRAETRPSCESRARSACPIRQLVAGELSSLYQPEASASRSADRIKASALAERGLIWHLQSTKNLWKARQRRSISQSIHTYDEMPVVARGSIRMGTPCSSTGGVISNACKIDAI